MGFGINPTAVAAGASGVSRAAPAFPATMARIRKLIGAGAVMLDDKAQLRGARVLSSKRSEALGVVNEEKLVRTSRGLTYRVLSIDGPMGSHFGPGPVFQETSRWLVLDSVGVGHVAASGKRTAVVGQRKKQLQEVFANVKHPRDPKALKWGKHERFTLPNGDQGVAFIGEVFGKTSKGDIYRLSLNNERDPLNR